MKKLMSLIATAALMAGAGANDAKAENFFKKMGKELRKAHERHEDMMEDAHERHRDIARHAAGSILYAGHADYGHGHGHYATVEVNEWVEGSWRIEYVEVRTAGHYEMREVEVVVPGYYSQVWVEPVYRIQRDSCGREVRIMVKCGYYRKVWCPPTTRTQCQKVWVAGECQRVPKKVWTAGHYENRNVRVWVCD
ncbi:MAG: hypothetical protein HYY18_19480 [Planctomycetes bacterium]|nr:hypothetical protein [Planctomycetota bacterium]